MISVGNNKAVICKGDFHPAQLYKGDKKIAGYIVESFENENGVTLENCYNDKLHNAQIFGNSIQDGTPTPDTPVEVQSVGELVTEGEYTGKYRVPIRARGKNLFDMLVRTVNNATEISYENGIQYCRGNANNAYSSSGGQLRLKFPTIPANKKITISFYGTCIERGAYNDVYTQFWVGYDYSYHEKMRRIIWAGSTGEKRKYVWTFTTTGDVNSFEMRLANSKWAIELNTFQIEIGDTATPYEPYIEPQTFNIYLDEPLRKVGNYADFVDFDKDVVVRQVGASKLTNFVAYPNSATPNTYWEHSTDYNSRNDSAPILTEYYPYSGSASGYKRVGEIVYANRPSVGKFHTASGLTGAIFISDDRFTTAEDLNSWIESNNVLFYYRLMNNLIQDIELPELPTFKGTTIYEIDTDIPATISGKYKKVEEL